MTRLYSVHSPKTRYSTIINETIVTTPPDVVRTLASSTVFVKASSRVNLDFAGMMMADTGLIETRSMMGIDSVYFWHLTRSQANWDHCVEILR